MRQDPALAKKKPSVLNPWMWLEWERQARAGLLPSLFWLAAQELRYLNPWYSPEAEASTEQALAYLDSSPAARNKLAA
jgi:predicted metal-dependent hydrolase